MKMKLGKLKKFVNELEVDTAIDEKNKIKATVNIDFKLPICEILLIFFLVLKITNVINWSWWLVFIPIFIELGIIIITLLIWGIMFFIASNDSDDRE